jgi:hypothetical protein
MGGIVISVVGFLVFFSALRILRSVAYDRKIPQGMAWLFGMIAWGAALCIVAFVLIIAEHIVDLSDGGGLWDWINFMIFVLTAGVLLFGIQKFFVFFDFVGMKNFWLASLQFEDPLINRNSVFEEAEREEIRALHREQTGEDLPIFAPMRPIPHTDPKKAQEDLDRTRTTPIESPALKEELERLNAGDWIDVTDTLRVNSFRNQTNARYENIRNMIVNPAERGLRFQLLFPRVTNEDLHDADRRFRVLQQIYEIFSSLEQERWLKPYEPFFEEVLANCFRVTIDSFDMPVETAFAHVHMPWNELRTHSGKIYIVTEFERLKRVEWIDIDQ